VEEFLLRLDLAGDELDIVHQQHRGLPVFLPKLGVAVLPDGADQLVGEVVALDIDDAGLRPALLHQMSDGVQQMGLAQTGIAVDEQGVVALRRLLRHGFGGGVGQLVLGPHHIRLKRKGVGVEQVAGLVGGHAVVGGQLLVVEDLHLHVRGEDVLQRRLDLGQEAGRCSS